MPKSKVRFERRPSAKVTDKPYPCVVFTDVVNSSKLWEQNPDKMNAALDRHWALVNSILGSYSGAFVVKTIGDANMIYFPTSYNSLLHAIAFAVRLQSQQMKRDSMINLRIGIAYGPVVSKNSVIQGHTVKDFFGSTVNTASRMESKVSEPGGIAFTFLHDPPDTILDAIANKLPRLKPFAFNEKCPDPNPQFVRSGRLLTRAHFESVMCQDVKLLKGVSDLVAYVFRVR